MVFQATDGCEGRVRCGPGDRPHVLLCCTVPRRVSAEAVAARLQDTSGNSCGEYSAADERELRTSKTSLRLRCVAWWKWRGRGARALSCKRPDRAVHFPRRRTYVATQLREHSGVSGRVAWRGAVARMTMGREPRMACRPLCRFCPREALCYWAAGASGAAFRAQRSDRAVGNVVITHASARACRRHHGSREADAVTSRGRGKRRGPLPVRDRVDVTAC